MWIRIRITGPLSLQRVASGALSVSCTLAKHNIFGLTFQVRRYFVPAFNHCHTEKVPSYLQSAMIYS
jgi:hypothetical protein